MGGRGGSRLSVTAVCVLALLLTTRTSPRLALGQHLPIRDEHHFQFQRRFPEVIHDTKLLPDGAEFVDYLIKATPRRYFFVSEEKAAHLKLLVTPCSAAVGWKLWFMNLSPDGSTTELAQDELLMQGTSREIDSRKPDLLKSYRGRDVSGYDMTDTSAGVYSLQLVAIDRNSSVRLFLSTSPHPDSPYPELPYDHKVRILVTDGNRIHVSWDPSPTDIQHDQPVQYCVSINSQGHYRSLCSAVGDITGDPPPTTAVGRRRTTKSSAREKPVVMSRDGVLISCVGSRTALSLGVVTSGQQKYYVDVFAINTKTGSSTRYSGTSASLDPKVFRLEDGRLETVYLKRSNPVKIFKYVLDRKTGQIIAAVRPCTGSVRVEISRDGRVVANASTTERSVERMLVKNPPRGVYTVSIYPDSPYTSFKLFISSNPSTYPFPAMPQDDWIKLLDVDDQCRSVKISWWETGSRQEYCLYLQRIDRYEPPHYGSQCSSSPLQRNPSDRVYCRTSRGYKSERRTRTEKVIKGLQSGSSYLVDVYVRRADSSEYLTYEPLIFKTKTNC